MDRDRLTQQLYDYLDGELTPADRAELSRTLRSEASARRLFWEVVRQETTLRGLLSLERGQKLAVGENLAEPLSSALRLEPRSTPQLRPTSTGDSPGWLALSRSSGSSKARWATVAAMAAGLVLMVGLAVWQLGDHKHTRSVDPGDRVDGSHRDPAQPSTQSLPTVLAAVGESPALLSRGGRQLRLGTGVELVPGDELTVPAGAAVGLGFAEGTRLTLGGNSVLTVPTEPTVVGAGLLLRQGELTAEVAPQPAERAWTVATEHAQVAVLGTRFTLTAGARRTRLEVRHGRVRLTRRADGASVLVEAGQMAEAVEGSSDPLLAVTLPDEPVAAEGPTVVAALRFGADGTDGLDSVVFEPTGTLLVAEHRQDSPATAGRFRSLVRRFSADSRRQLASLVLADDAAISDMICDPAGRITVCAVGLGDTGDRVVRLDRVRLTVSWSAALPARESGQTGHPIRSGPSALPPRLAAHPDGRIAAGSGSSVTVFDEAGKSVASWSLADKRIHDLAAAPDGKMLVVVGETVAKTPTPSGAAFAAAFDWTGQPLWSVYGWSREQLEAANLGAATVARRVAFGPAGQLFIAGESVGGNSLWSRQSHNLGEPMPRPAGRRDPHSETFATGTTRFAFLGRLDPATGRGVVGTHLVGRTGALQCADVLVHGLTTDERGRVYLAGWAEGGIPETANAPRVNGRPLPAARSGAVLAIYEPELLRLWCGCPVAGASARSRAVAVGSRTIALVGDAHGNLLAPLSRPTDTGELEVGGGSDGWLVLLRRSRLGL